jgi:SMC interacting uncharacterized protein involved in chromosome segregation
MTQPLIFGDARSLTRKLVNHMDALEQEIAELKVKQRKLEDQLKEARKRYWQHKHNQKIQEAEPITGP